MATANEKLHDFEVAQAVRWNRVAGAQAKFVVDALRAVNPEIRALITAENTTTLSADQADELKRNVTAVIRRAHRSAAAGVVAFAQDVAVESADIEARLIRRVL